MRFVDDQQFVDEGATAHKTHGFDLDFVFDQFAGRGTRPFACVGVAFDEHFEVVLQCAHPRGHFFLFRSGEEANVFADSDGCAGDDDFGESSHFEGLLQRGGDGEQGFARAGLTE